MVPYTEPLPPPVSWLRCCNYLSPSTLLKTMLWCPLLEGSPSNSQSHQLQGSCCCFCKQRTWLSSSVVPDSIDSQRKWPQREKMVLVYLWRLSYTSLSYVKNYLSQNIAGRQCDLCSLEPLPEADFMALLISSTCCLPFWFSLFFICAIHGWRTKIFLIYLTSGQEAAWTHAAPLRMLLRGYAVAVIYSSKRKKRNICIQFSISRWYTACFILQ